MSIGQFKFNEHAQCNFMGIKVEIDGMGLFIYTIIHC